MPLPCLAVWPWRLATTWPTSRSGCLTSCPTAREQRTGRRCRRRGIVARDDVAVPPAPPRHAWRCSSAGSSASTSIARLATAAIGDGDGMIVQRGFPRPPSYYSARLRGRAEPAFLRRHHATATASCISYADRVEPADRWAIAAYIRALQASASASLADVPPDKRSALQ